jgi:hypothetical protein
MDLYTFISSYYKVETVIGLLAFVAALVFAYFSNQTKTKRKNIGQIISQADTSGKAALAAALAEVFPPYKIPDLTSRQGFQLVKMHLTQKAEEFKIRARLFGIGIGLFCLIVFGVLVNGYIKLSKVKEGIRLETHGDKSPAIHANEATVNY